MTLKEGEGEEEEEEEEEILEGAEIRKIRARCCCLRLVFRTSLRVEIHLIVDSFIASISGQRDYLFSRNASE